MNGKHFRHKLGALSAVGSPIISIKASLLMAVRRIRPQLTTASTAGELSPTTSREGHLAKANTFNYKSAIFSST